MKTLRVITLAFSMTLFVRHPCAAQMGVPGASIDLESGFELVFRIPDSSRYLLLPGGSNSLKKAFDTAEWVVPEGFTIERSEIVANEASVSWQEIIGARQVDAQGYKVVISCKIKVGPAPPTGTRSIYLKAPELVALAKSNGTSIFEPLESHPVAGRLLESKPSQGLFHVGTIEVFASEEALRQYRQRILVVAGCAIVLIIAIVYFIRRVLRARSSE